MATKTQTGMKPVEALSGKVTGRRFSVVLDDIHKDDIWTPGILPVLQQDGIGSAEIVEGVTKFTFRTTDHATIAFVAAAGNLKVDEFFVDSDGKEQA